MADSWTKDHPKRTGNYWMLREKLYESDNPAPVIVLVVCHDGKNLSVDRYGFLEYVPFSHFENAWWLSIETPEPPKELT